jgi:dihydroorotate dehydrogenase (NAD+) catalytic subunit
VKSLSAREWVGNPAPRLHPAAAGMLNAVGLQNPGIPGWIDHEWPALAATGARVIVSIWGRTVDEFDAAARALAPILASVIAIEANVSCPNLEDRADIFSHSASATSAVTQRVVAAVAPCPVFVKLSPNCTDVRPIARAAVDAGATGLTLINTVMGLGVDAATRWPVLGNGPGGLSGPAIKPVALRIVHEVRVALPDVPIIGTGGVEHGEDAAEMLIVGATAVGVGTATFRNPRAPIIVRDELAAWAASHHVGAIRDLTNSMLEPT